MSIQGCGSSVGIASPQRQIPSETDMLHGAIERVLSYVSELEGALSNACRGDAAPPQPNGPCVTEDVLVPIADYIRSARYKANSAADRLESLLRRLEV